LGQCRGWGKEAKSNKYSDVIAKKALWRDREEKYWWSSSKTKRTVLRNAIDYGHGYSKGKLTNVTSLTRFLSCYWAITAADQAAGLWGTGSHPQSRATSGSQIHAHSSQKS
jgi:hypothetical protein